MEGLVRPEWLAPIPSRGSCPHDVNDDGGFFGSPCDGVVWESGRNCWVALPVDSNREINQVMDCFWPQVHGFAGAKAEAVKRRQALETMHGGQYLATFEPNDVASRAVHGTDTTVINTTASRRASSPCGDGRGGLGTRQVFRPSVSSDREGNNNSGAAAQSIRSARRGTCRGVRGALDVNVSCNSGSRSMVPGGGSASSTTRSPIRRASHSPSQPVRGALPRRLGSSEQGGTSSTSPQRRRSEVAETASRGVRRDSYHRNDYGPRKPSPTSQPRPPQSKDDETHLLLLQEKIKSREAELAEMKAEEERCKTKINAYKAKLEDVASRESLVVSEFEAEKEATYHRKERAASHDALLRLGEAWSDKPRARSGASYPAPAGPPKNGNGYRADTTLADLLHQPVLRPGLASNQTLAATSAAAVPAWSSHQPAAAHVAAARRKLPSASFSPQRQSTGRRLVWSSALAPSGGLRKSGAHDR